MEKRKYMSSVSTRAIIGLWRKNIGKLRVVHKNRHIYLQMCEELKSRHNITLTSAELRTRINNLARKFRDEKKKNGTSYGSPSAWMHYSEINRFMGHCKSWNSLEKMDESAQYIEPCIEAPAAEDSSAPETEGSQPGTSDNVSEPVKNKQKIIFEERMLTLAEKDSDINEKYLKVIIQQGEQIVNIMQESNDLLRQLINK